jgi:hypothetical protein
MMETKKWFWAILSISVILIFCNSLQAETTNCTPITSLPYVINTQGIYCLKGHLSTSMTSGNAITINTNNVVLDLNGYKIGGQAAGAATVAYGIYAYQRQNITIRNGTVRGFLQGIGLTDSGTYTTSQGHIIEDTRADMNTWVGIGVEGRGNIIRNNQVVDTGGSSNTVNAVGIVVKGPGNRIINNDVYETKEGTGGNAMGIWSYLSHGLVVDNNRIGNTTSGAGTSYGIYFNPSIGVITKGNSIFNMNYGIYYGSNTGLYMNNLVSGCANPFTGGTPAGSTNYSN